MSVARRLRERDSRRDAACRLNARMWYNAGVSKTRGRTSNLYTCQTSHPESSICVRCGSRLARDNRGIECSHHKREFDPRCDGEWPNKLAAYLAENVGGTVHPTAHFGITERDSNSVSRSIAKLRKAGWVIESVRGQDCYHVELVVPAGRKCDTVGGTGEMPTDDGETP